MLAALSSLALAGGAACDSKKGAHPEMSAEAKKSFKDGHAWLFEHGHGDAHKGEVSKDKAAEKPAQGVVEI
jgi:hypothetical protein